MSQTSSIVFRAGPRARALIAERGLQAADVSAVPAAAGGPKGLALVPLEKFLFGDWLTVPTADGQPRLLAGASIGAWLMAGAAQTDALAGLERARAGYFAQRYPLKPSQHYVSLECGKVVQTVLGDLSRLSWAAGRQLAVVTARSRGALRDKGSAPRFAAAALTNVFSRRQLARYFERVVFTHADPGTEGGHEAAFERLRRVIPRDAFGLQLCTFNERNLQPALLASGSIPLLADPVRSPDAAPPGLYWDGAMVDYHIDWNWQALPGIVIYPHFVDHIVPGWLDKHLGWRRARGPHLDNLLIISPSPDLLARLPLNRLPGREDFTHYGLDHDARIVSWTRAVAECQRMADDFARFVENPDPAQLLPLG